MIDPDGVGPRVLVHRAPGGKIACHAAAVDRTRRTIDEVLAAAQSRLDRVAPEDLAVEQAAGAPVVDIRAADQRASEVTGHDQRIVLVCNDGYASTLAAAGLHELGLHRATDLAGGFRLWRRLIVGS